MAQSYKIFIKDVPLIIAPPQNGCTGAPIDWMQSNPLSAIRHVMETQGVEHFVIHSHDPEEIFNHFRSNLHLIQAAGGIVWNRLDELLMIYRRGRWDLPKGKIEEGETIETAALREVEEESGVGMLRLLEKFDTTYHIYKERNTWVLKETHWYEMISQDEGNTIPQTSEGITKVKWVKRQDVPEKIRYTYASMHELVSSVLQKGYKAEKYQNL